MSETKTEPITESMTETTTELCPNSSSSGSHSPQVLRIRLKESKNDTNDSKKVSFTSETVDNEGMDKKKSKCCCIFEKSRQFGESSSEESDDETDHCFGHKRKHKHNNCPNNDQNHNKDSIHL
jgi:hypothetical protein